MKSCLMFSGQGSQYVGMMKDIAEAYPIAAGIRSNADRILAYKLSDIMFDGPTDVLKETRYTQPALFVHSVALFELLADSLKFDAVAGHSVGEYAALYTAGVLSFEDALRLVSLRGELMFKAGEYLPGTMFAVIGMDEAQLVKLCEELTERGDGAVIVAANFNSPGQIVISGSADYLRQNAKAFKENGAKMVTELVVSGAFHSPLMLPAKEKLETAIREINFNNAAIPLYTNVFAQPMTDASQLKEALILQLTSPVLWTKILNNMFSDGIRNFIELGPGKVLQGLAKRTLSDITIEGFDKREDIEKSFSR